MKVMKIICVIFNIKLLLVIIIIIIIFFIVDDRVILCI